MIRAASAAVGGSGSGVGWRGLRATLAGFDLIQPHRTAAESAPLPVMCTWRIAAADSGSQTCGLHSMTLQPTASQSCGG